MASKMGRLTISQDQARLWGVEIHSGSVVLKGPKEALKNGHNVLEIIRAIGKAESTEKQAQNLIEKSDYLTEDDLDPKTASDSEEDFDNATQGMKEYDNAWEDYERISNATGIFRKMV